MPGNKKDDKAVIIAILPAIIVAVAGIIGSIYSYKVGTDSIRIPIQATQTAQAITGSSISFNPIGIPIAIDSQLSWQPTGFKVSFGDVISVKVVGGKWSGWRNSDGEFKWSENRGDGFSPECGSSDGVGYVGDCPVKQAKITALVARIGSTKYNIGNVCIFKADADGELEFIMNDDYKDDNFGILAVQISILNSPNFVLSDDCGFVNQ